MVVMIIGVPQAVFLLIGKTSALTMNIAGVIKDWMLIFFSFYLFHAPVTALNLAGYAFCCSGAPAVLMLLLCCGMSDLFHVRLLQCQHLAIP